METTGFGIKMPKMSDISEKFSDLLGLGEFSNPIGEQVLEATSEMLIAPDWSLFLKIADDVNRNYEGEQYAIKAIQRRLKSENNKVISLTLTLCDALISNCHKHLHMAMGKREFMEHIEEVAYRRDLHPEVRQQILYMIQRWGLAFKTARSYYFYDCYTRLNAKGFKFPEVKEEDLNIAIDKSSKNNKPSNPVEELERLKSDLLCVKEKIELCNEMVQHSPGIEYDEVLRELVGFLEACRPRLVDLIQAGSAGNLDAEVMDACLTINDALIKVLDAERHGKIIILEKIDLNFNKTGNKAVKSKGNPLERGATSSFSIADEEDDDNYKPLSSNWTGNKPAETNDNSKTENKPKGSSANENLSDDLVEFENFLNSRP